MQELKTKPTLKNFGLSEIAFEEMVCNLKEGQEELFEKIFLGHFKDCMNYLENNCSASYEDAYDVSMETLLQFRRLLLQDKIRYGNLRFLFTRMAMQLFWKWKKAKPVSESADEMELEVPVEEYDEESIQLLDKAWSKLGEACQRLLKEFYYNGIQLITLARMFDKSDAAVRQEKKRCLQKLRAIYFEI